MKVTIINCFESSVDRVQAIKEYFEEKNNKVSVIQSDFLHIKKEKRKDAIRDYFFVETLPYKKNISLKRLLSHFLFSKEAFRQLENFQTDLLYVVAPPNSLVKQAAKYKREHQIKLVIDIYDLWPESMPVEKVKRILAVPIKYWANLRNKYLKQADVVITECNLYQEKLKNVLKDIRVTGTVYLTRKLKGEIQIPQKMDTRTLGLCYLGSINNIINIDLIVKLVGAINKRKKVVLHIIGKGERKEEFLETLKENNIEYVFYGEVYDQNEQNRIFEKCAFGLNLMKESVCVGLTMKSLDYFKVGLPILNNIKWDTSILVDKRNIGYNITVENADEKAKQIVSLTEKELIQLRKNTKNVFYDTFAEKVYRKHMDELLGGII